MEEISNQIIPIVYCSPGSERDSEITRKRKTVLRMDQKYTPVGQRISSLCAKQVINAEGTIKKGPESKSTSTIPLRDNWPDSDPCSYLPPSRSYQDVVGKRNRKGTERNRKKQDRNSLDSIRMRYTKMPVRRDGHQSPAARCSTRGEEIRQVDRRSSASLAVVMW